MATRHWTLNMDGARHTVRIFHGYWLGRRRIWLDEQLITDQQRLFDFGSLHAFTIGTHACELGITTNGVTYNYYLLVDGEPQRSDEDATKGRPARRPSRGVQSERVYWQRLAQLTGFMLLPSKSVPNWNRLLGAREGHLILVELAIVALSEANVPVVSITITHGAGVNIDNARQQIIDGTATGVWLERKAKRNPDVNDQYAWAGLKFDVKKVSPEDLAGEIDTFVREVIRRTRPRSAFTCDAQDCKQPFPKLNRLVFVNGLPQFLCDDCVQALSQLSERNKRVFDAAPSNLLRASLAGFACAFSCGVVWAILLIVLERVHGLDIGVMLSIGIPAAITKVMNKVVTKPSLNNNVMAIVLSLVGIVLGVYGFNLFSLPASVGIVGLTQHLSAAWNRMFAAQTLLRGSILFTLLIGLAMLLASFLEYRQQMNHYFKPEVEIVEDVAILQMLRDNDLISAQAKNP